MSLFASLGQGDIWALSGISFASPINDLLEKGEFSLENLLEEDELIQEVKAKNEQLIEFLSREQTIDHLLDFIIDPAGTDATDLRLYKYPYMSCEVICCEVPEILHNLVERADGKYLNKLFSFLASPHKLDYYLAGYFEKILEMLFRRMTVPMMSFFNNAGTQLLVQFLNHMDNYSIMQIVQRLMLPHIPFSNLNDNEMDMSEEERMQRQCNWSFSVESCQLLFDRMLEYKDADVPLHISDLLITVLQLSPPETLVISFLCEPACAQRLMRAVVGDVGADEIGERDVGLADLQAPGDQYSCAASVSLAAISVLESLNSRLFEASLPFDQSMSQALDGSGTQEHLQVVRGQIDAICNELLPFVPKLQGILQQYVDNNPCQSVVNQSKTSARRLGHRGLQLVKLVESIVRMSSAAVDDSFCQSGLYKTCLQLLFVFENNSFLHLSVQRIVITILESDSSRSATQRHLLTECDLLGALMARIVQYSPTGEAPVAPAEGSVPVSSSGILPKHSSVLGNLVLIAQALSVGLDLEGAEAQQQQDAGRLADGAARSLSNLSNLEDGGSSFLSDDSDTSPSDAKGGSDSNDASMAVGAAGLGAGERPGGLRYLLSSGTAGADAECGALLAAWDNFVQNSLHAILDHQMVGSYSAIANISGISQDDPLKLGVDLDMFHMNNGATDRAMGFSTALNSEMGSTGVWRRDQFVTEEEEEDDEDDDFMFQGPSATSQAFHDHGAGDAGGFQANFEFMQTQNLSGNAFAAFDNADGSAVTAFADFAAFGDDSAAASFSPDSSGQTGGFEGFANFADFGSTSVDSADGNPASVDAPDSVIDFAPSEF